MKKLISFCMLAIFLIGCSSADPSISDVNVSDETPATGQRILLQVFGLTDNPPLRYVWQSSGGEFEDLDERLYWAYWKAPEKAGLQTISCRVIDDKDNEEIITFNINVTQRQVEESLVEGAVLSMVKQAGSRIGGIWVSMEDETVRFISSAANQETTWEGAFTAMLVDFDEGFLTYTLWGAQEWGREITVQTSEEETTIKCRTCYYTDVINDFEIDVLGASILWVGANSGIQWYDSANDIWGTYKITKTYDLYQGIDYVYAATALGILTLNGEKDPLYPGDSRAVLETEDGDSVMVWSITDSLVHLNGQPLSLQPPHVASSLDSDLDGNIWCGKYWWDGSVWQSPPGIGDTDIIKSVASNEGLVYLLSDSGALLRW